MVAGYGVFVKEGFMLEIFYSNTRDSWLTTKTLSSVRSPIAVRM